MDYPSSFAMPLEVAIEASNGASDYGNKFGEPVISGFARSFGLRIGNEHRIMLVLLFDFLRLSAISTDMKISLCGRNCMFILL